MLGQLPLTFWIVLGFIFGACIGSFLTVVVTRLPQMLIRDWKNDCIELTGQPLDPSPRFNLALPRSHCSQCHQQLLIWHNIPLISFLRLRGRCGFCQKKIGGQYALIEWISAILTVSCLLYWGIGFKLVAPLITLYFFIALAFIDYNTRLLPDILTFGLLWLGLIISSNPRAAIFGATGGYVIPWLINRLFLWLRKKPGMGHGDFKCLAAIGAWVGLTGSVGCYVLAALISLITAVPLLLQKKVSLDSMLPFGPFLCIVGFAWINFEPRFSWLINHFILT